MSALEELDFDLQSVNRVPLDPIIDEVRDYIRTQVDLSQAVYSDGRKELGPLAILAIRVDMEEDTLRKLVWQGRGGTTIDFDLADRLLCKMGRSDVWHGRLNELYSNVVLIDDGPKRAYGRPSGARMCEGAECSTEFVPDPRSPHQRFCSTSCKRKSYWKRRREREGVKPRFGTRYGQCPNGHERSPENTYVRPSGSVSCRVCGREKEAERYADPQYRQKRIESARLYRERKRKSHAA